MKKKYAWIVAATIMAGTMLAGCGNSDSKATTEQTSEKAESEEETTKDDGKLEFKTKVTKLADYKGLEVYKSDATVSDDSITQQIEYLKNQYATVTQKKEGKVADGDVVNIDYTGKINGKEFDGGSATGYDLTIGSDSFIDGFEDGLIGKKIGDTVELKLKFPDDYGKNDTTGETSDYVKITTKAKINDEFVKKNLTYSGAKTVEEYKTWLKDYLRTSQIFNAVWSDYIDKCEIEDFKEDEYEASKADVLAQFEKNLQSAYGYTLDEYKKQMSLSEDDWNKQVKTAAESSLKSKLVLLAIADKEGISYEGGDYTKKLEEMAQMFGYEDGAAFEEDLGKSQSKLYMLNEDVARVIAANVKVVADPETTAQTTTAAAEEETTTK